VSPDSYTVRKQKSLSSPGNRDFLPAVTVTSKTDVTGGNLRRSSGLQKMEKPAMLTRLKLKPGPKGTKRLVAEHGDALVCVRYRYDEASSTRIKTVELIVE